MYEQLYMSHLRPIPAQRIRIYIVYLYCLRMQLRHDLYSNSKTFLYRKILIYGYELMCLVYIEFLKELYFVFEKYEKKYINSKKVIYF